MCHLGGVFSGGGDDGVGEDDLEGVVCIGVGVEVDVCVAFVPRAPSSSPAFVAAVPEPSSPSLFLIVIRRVFLYLYQYLSLRNPCPASSHKSKGKTGNNGTMQDETRRAEWKRKIPPDPGDNAREINPRSESMTVSEDRVSNRVRQLRGYPGTVSGERKSEGR